MRETPRSPNTTLSQRAGNSMDKKAAEKRDAAFMALAHKAALLTIAYDGHSAPRPEHDLSDTAQGDLEAAGRGSLGLTPYVRDVCRASIERYYAARAARQEREKRNGSS